MTVYEIEAAGEIGRQETAGDVWAKVMVPLLTAALVIALGLILVGVTSGTDSSADSPARSAITSGR